MKIGDIVSLSDINKWKNKKYRETFNSERFGCNDGSAWWRRTKKNILKNTKFKVVELSKEEGETNAKI